MQRGEESAEDDELRVEHVDRVAKGDAQDAFVAKYESMQATFNNFSQMLEEYAKLMNTAAQKLQETDTALQGTMNSFGG